MIRKSFLNFLREDFFQEKFNMTKFSYKILSSSTNHFKEERKKEEQELSIRKTV